MKVTVSREVFEKVNSQFRVGLLLFEEIDNHSHVDQSKHLLLEMEKLTSLLHTNETVKTSRLLAPEVVARLEFGKKAKHYKTSVQHLIQAVLQHKSVAARDTLTNLLRYISLKHIIPINADDVSKIKGDITFAVATGKERIGIIQRLQKGALYYHDQHRALGAKFDYWKNSRTALHSRSRTALIHLEVLQPVSAQKLKEIMEELARVGEAFCGGKVKMAILDKKRRAVQL